MLTISIKGLHTFGSISESTYKSNWKNFAKILSKISWLICEYIRYLFVQKCSALSIYFGLPLIQINFIWLLSINSFHHSLCECIRKVQKRLSKLRSMSFALCSFKFALRSSYIWLSSRTANRQSCVFSTVQKLKSRVSQPKSIRVPF